MGQPVSISCNYNGGHPTANPNNPPISPGNTTITWAPAAGGGTFPSTGGVVFTPSWIAAGNSQPTYNASSGTYSTTDSNNLQKGDSAVEYSYSLSMISPNGTLYTAPDPDVTNTPPV